MHIVFAAFPLLWGLWHAPTCLAQRDPTATVAFDHWAYDVVQQCVDKGIIIGLPDGRFLGDRPVNGYMMAMMFSRLADVLHQPLKRVYVPTPPDLDPEVRVTVPFDHWAYDAVTKLAEAGLGGCFTGPKPCTRGELAVLVASLFGCTGDRIDDLQDFEMACLNAFWENGFWFGGPTAPSGDARAHVSDNTTYYEAAYVFSHLLELKPEGFGHPWVLAAPMPVPGQKGPGLVPQTGHAGRVNTVAFSPDGNTVASSGEDTTVILWEAATGAQKRTLAGHAGVVFSVAFSPDSKTLASGNCNGSVILWDAAAGARMRTLRGHALRVYSVAFSPDGRTLASASWDGTVILWDAATGAQKQVLRKYSDYVYSVAFSRDSKALASGSENGTVILWDATTGAEKQSFQTDIDSQAGLPLPVLSVAFSPDGKTLASGSVDNVTLWEADAGVKKQTLTGHKGAANSVAFSQDGNTVAEGTWDGVVLWDAAKGEEKQTLKGHTDCVESVAFSPDGKTLASAGDDKKVILWDAATGTQERSLKGHTGWVWCVASSPDGKALASGSYDGSVILWDAATGAQKQMLTGHTDKVSSVAFSLDGKALASGSYDKTVILWDAATGARKQTLTGHTGSVDSVTFSPDGKTLASGGEDKTVILWDVATGAAKQRLLGHTAWVRRVAFSLDGKTVASGSDDHTVILWDAGTGAQKQTLKGHAEPVSSVAFSPDSKALASGSGDGTVVLWDAATGEKKQTLTGHPGWVSSVAFSPDSKTLASGRDDCTVILWDTATGARERTLEGHTSSVTSVAFSPGGKALASGSGDGTIIVWDVPSGRQLATMLHVWDTEDSGTTARTPIQVAAMDVPSPAGNEWLVATPEGYFDCSANAARYIRWDVKGKLFPAECYKRRFYRPDLVRKALRGEKLSEPAMTDADILPSSLFVDLKDGQAVAGDTVTVTVEARGVRDIKEVELLVDNRLLAPEQARGVEVVARPIEVAARSAGLPYRFCKQFTYHVTLPKGSPSPRLRAVAYDETGLGSPPVEVVVQQTGSQPVRGNLYVLSVGVSRYQHANNLLCPALDAQAVADRFGRERAGPLYQEVQTHVHNKQQDTTLAGVREGLRWLRKSVRSGHRDTVVIYLSGHGYCTDEGSYYFATYEFDPARPAETGLSGKELEALESGLPAKAVFLLVDTCHAGGLWGQNDALSNDISGHDDVFLLASSSARQCSYESEKAWGHGAFTLALLNSLARKDLEISGSIHFSELIGPVRLQVVALMQQAGHPETPQVPVVRGPEWHMDESVATARP